METTLIIAAMKKKTKSDSEKEFVFSVLKSESGTYLTMMSLEPIAHNNDMVYYDGQGHKVTVMIYHYKV